MQYAETSHKVFTFMTLIGGPLICILVMLICSRLRRRRTS